MRAPQSKHLPTRRIQLRGFAYTEVLLSVLLLGILLVPAMQALNAGISGNAATSGVASRQMAIRSKMEDLLSKPFGTLYAQTYLGGGNTTTSISSTYSDAPGTANRRVVVFYRFDATTNVLSANDTGLLYINVYFEDEGSATGLQTLMGRWW